MHANQTVRSYKQLHGWSVKKILRHAILSASYAGYRRVGAIDKALANPRVHFLYLHHVFGDQEQKFQKLLKWLVNTGHALLSYSEAVERVRSGPIDRPYVCFSFDDGLKSCVRAGELLRQMGVSACFFLNDYPIDNSDCAALSEYCRTRLGLSSGEFLTWSDVESLTAMGHEIGGHTVHHVDMARMETAELQEEVHKNREVLARHCAEVKHFAWPYGRLDNFCRAAGDIVSKAGYVSCASAVRGCHTVSAPEQCFCLTREHCTAAWPLGHIAFFLARSSLKVTKTNSY